MSPWEVASHGAAFLLGLVLGGEMVHRMWKDALRGQGRLP